MNNRKSAFPLSRPWIEAVQVTNLINFQPLTTLLINALWDEIGRTRRVFLLLQAEAQWLSQGKASYFEMSFKPPRGDFRLAMRYN